MKIEKTIHYEWNVFETKSGTREIRKYYGISDSLEKAKLQAIRGLSKLSKEFFVERISSRYEIIKVESIYKNVLVATERTLIKEKL